MELKEEAKFVKRHSLSRVIRIRERIEEYITSLKIANVEKNKLIGKDLETFADIELKLKFIGKIKFILYGLLYVSVLSAVLGNLFIIEKALLLISNISGIIGSTIIIAGIATVNGLMNLYIADLFVVSNIIIAKITNYKNQNNKKVKKNVKKIF
jgi:hypothetical protein